MQEWPGNVRQLENTVARLVALSTGGEIGPQALSSMPAQPAGGSFGPQDELGLWERIEAFEREQIEQALVVSGGNQSEAARRLRVSRSAFVDRLKKYGLQSS
jgi:two-component system response regulator AtoC